MSTTTTTSTSTTLAPEAAEQIDIIVSSEATESVAWLTLAKVCESADDTAAAWLAARDYYVATFPNGKRGKATNPANTFKSRKSDTLCVRKAHPKLTAAAIVDAYGSVRSAATAIRSAAKSAPDAKSAKPADPTPAERLAAVTAAVRLAVSAGCSADDIAAAVAAAAE